MLMRSGAFPGGTLPSQQLYHCHTAWAWFRVFSGRKMGPVFRPDSGHQNGTTWRLVLRIPNQKQKGVPLGCPESGRKTGPTFRPGKSKKNPAGPPKKSLALHFGEGNLVLDTKPSMPSPPSLSPPPGPHPGFPFGRHPERAWPGRLRYLQAIFLQLL